MIAVAPKLDDIDVSESWIPQEGSQVAFMTCPFEEVLLHGDRGGGKTDVFLMDFRQHVDVGWGEDWKGWIFRRTYKELGDVIAKAQKWFRRFDPSARFNIAKSEWTWPTGEVLSFRHFAKPSDYWGYHGHARPWIGWEELTNWGTDECYRSMFSCCRSTRKGMPRKIRATTNSYGVGHNWIKDRFQLAGNWKGINVIDNAVDDDGEPEAVRVAIRSTIEENRILLDADPGYKKRILQSASNQAMRDAWSSGSWDIVAGGMFDDVWSEDNCVPDFDVPDSWRIDRAFWSTTCLYRYATALVRAVTTAVTIVIKVV